MSISKSVALGYSPSLIRFEMAGKRGGLLYGFVKLWIGLWVGTFFERLGQSASNGIDMVADASDDGSVGLLAAAASAGSFIQPSS